VKSLQDRVVVFTGAAGGIASAFARELPAAAMNVALANLDVESIERVAAVVRACSGQCSVARTEVSRSGEVEGLLARTLA